MHARRRMHLPDHRGSAGARTLELAVLLLTATVLSGIAALPAESANRPGERPLLTSWVVSAGPEQQLSRRFLIVRLRTSEPTALRLAVEARSRAGGASRVTVWRTVRVERAGVRTVRLRKTAASDPACARTWRRRLAPWIILRSPGSRRLQTRSIGQAPVDGPEQLCAANPIAPWLPSGQKP